jgi:hypothetical protein
MRYSRWALWSGKSSKIVQFRALPSCAKRHTCRLRLYPPKPGGMYHPAPTLDLLVHPVKPAEQVCMESRKLTGMRSSTA